jgi:serine/threonine protein kinase
MLSYYGQFRDRRRGMIMLLAARAETQTVCVGQTISLRDDGSGMLLCSGDGGTLGAGAFGVVRSRKAVLFAGGCKLGSIDVAVKTSRKGGAAQLSNEIRAHAHLMSAGAHRGIVPFLGVTNIDGREAIVMPLLVPLRDCRLTPPRHVEFAVQLVECVSRLNGAGLIHGDIKPGNTLVSPGEGKLALYVCDLGLSVWGRAVVGRSLRRSGTFPYRIASWFTEIQQTRLREKHYGFECTDRLAAVLTVFSVSTGFGLCRLVSGNENFTKSVTRDIGSRYFTNRYCGDNVSFVDWLFEHEARECADILHECCIQFRQRHSVGGEMYRVLRKCMV